MMRSIPLVVGCVLVLAASRLEAAEPVRLENCFLAPDEEVQVPAQESGVLMKIPVRDGQLVSKGDLLAQIDDIVPQVERKVAASKLEVAKEQAKDDINVRYARLAAKVAAKELEKSLEANAKTRGTVPEIEIDKQRLERDKAILSIEKAEKDLVVAVLQMHVSEGELEKAAVQIERRRIFSPLDALVVKLSRHEGEWVNPGDTVIRLLRVDRLRVEGSLNVKEHSPAEIQGRPVEVVVTLTRGQRESFPGKIVYVNPLIQSNGAFQVRAEVQNRKLGGVWVLSPGLSAVMVIDLK